MAPEVECDECASAEEVADAIALIDCCRAGGWYLSIMSTECTVDAPTVTGHEAVEGFEVEVERPNPDVSNTVLDYLVWIT